VFYSFIIDSCGHLTSPDLDGRVDATVDLASQVDGTESISGTAGIEAGISAGVVLEVVVDDHGRDVVVSIGVVHVHVPVVVLDGIAGLQGAGQQVIVAVPAPPGGAVGMAAEDHGQDN